jgi:hypothetical protein
MTTMTDPIATEYEVRERPDGGLRARITRTHAHRPGTDALGRAFPSDVVPVGNTWRVHVADAAGREVRGYTAVSHNDDDFIKTDADFPFNPHHPADELAALERATKYAHDVIALLRDHAAVVNEAHTRLRLEISGAENRSGGVVR